MYDTVTEGMLGWQFLRTRRWLAFISAAILFAIACFFLSQWQFDRGQQAEADNRVVAANWAASPVPLEQALPALSTYDVSQNWQRVSMSGVYRTDEQLVVRNRSNGSDNGFEVVTPLQLSDGSIFLVDRGWVAPSPTDPLAPATIPSPAAGTVSVLAQLRPSEASNGTKSGNQVSSITLPLLQQTFGADLYTGAYGVLDSETPAAETPLQSIQTTMPTEDVGTHYSYALQWLFFALIGFFALGLGMRNEHRRLNSDDPDEQLRAAERVRKRATKAFTDEELEDEEIDGFLPLTRWGAPTGSALPPAAAPRAALHTTQPPEPTTPPIFIIDSADKPDEDDS
ncbi:hypothetical protein GCM10011399_26020 [Subtercola lobariae]|uniref:SURF1-like protein n=1 Tax=Subtercola lobariae TaxID=1588641 RepID=A0A917B8M0_9MICO|nr:hypothetical protein GCM10011399_26020 [Subtercola lobariae]